jgi:hypothetical protein
MLFYILQKENMEEKLYIFRSSLLIQCQDHLLSNPSAPSTSNIPESAILLLEILQNWIVRRHSVG